MSTTATVTLQQKSDYRFEVTFEGGAPPFMTDEPPPLGQGAGPSPVQLLTAAVANCLTDSLLFAMRKFKQQPEPIQARAVTTVDRNEQNRLRVQRIEVALTIGRPATEIHQVERIVEQFQDFCTVSQSVARGIPIEVSVFDASGVKLK